MPTRSPALLLTLLSLLVGPAAADDAPRPGDWMVVGEPEVPTPGAWMPGLWIPVRSDGERVMVADVLGRHAALREVEDARCIVELTRLDPAGERPIDVRWQDATLEPAGGAALKPVVEGDAWRGDAVGLRRMASDGRQPGSTQVLLRFPALDPTAHDLTVRLPVADGETIVVRFARVKELVAAAEAELAAWKAHVEANSMISAIQPYLDCDGYRALRARGDAVTAALVLRELARGEEQRDATALPRFLCLHVLADTSWGRTQQVAGHGDDAVARRVLARWRSLGHPSLPGASPR